MIFISIPTPFDEKTGRAGPGRAGRLAAVDERPTTCTERTSRSMTGAGVTWNVRTVLLLAEVTERTEPMDSQGRNHLRVARGRRCVGEFPGDLPE